jgi:N-glycosylase/DNA lyase
LLVHLTETPASDFDLEMTLDSGQVFHWDKIDNGFIGTIGDQPAYVEQRGNLLFVSRGSQDLVRKYFALDHSLAEICASFPDDPVMNAARNFCRGLRVIRQPKWECVATFICSSMKRVTHIRQISRKLRERFGHARKIDPPEDGFAVANNREVFTFPSAAQLAESSEKELRECALGYRAKNLLATARLVANGDVDLEKMAELSDVDLWGMLCELPGVGAKVANCVMLFAYERLRAFPVDVWIERVLRENYFSGLRKLNAARLRTFTQKYFGEHGGYAQQYLFHYARKSSRQSGEFRQRRDLSPPRG